MFTHKAFIQSFKNAKMIILLGVISSLAFNISNLLVTVTKFIAFIPKGKK